ncbi:hypothetical protein ABZ464_27490 [Streptomyces sp. NPDC005820]|uniref:hypothetical protein n=1 Tax=Streptomyces sp. NPDC005820 TaxID=3157069 RepID=UPI0033F0C98E
MTEQEWLDSLAAQLPERDLEWVVELARICSTECVGDKPPTGEARRPAGPGTALDNGDDSKQCDASAGFQTPSQTDGV